MNNNNWLSTLMGALLLLLIAGGLYTWHTVEQARRRADTDKVVADREREKAEFERELRTFAEAHPDLKLVQELVDELEDEIQLRRKKLNQLAVEMRRASRAPESDPDYIRWNRAILDLQKKQTALLAERKETWLEWKKVENNPDKTTDLAKTRDARVKKARALAEDTRKQFNDLRNNDRPSEPVSSPEPEKKSEKPQRKKLWGIF